MILGSYSLSDHEKPLLSKVSDDESSSVDLRHQYESKKIKAFDSDTSFEKIVDQQSILTASSNELSYLTNERPPPYSVTENPRPESLMELKTLIEDVVRTDFNSYMFYLFLSSRLIFRCASKCGLKTKVQTLLFALYYLNSTYSFHFKCASIKGFRNEAFVV